MQNTHFDEHSFTDVAPPEVPKEDLGNDENAENEEEPEEKKSCIPKQVSKVITTSISLYLKLAHFSMRKSSLLTSFWLQC